MPDVAKPATERVTMIWPADLKQQLGDLVGKRGLTKFTLDAVREALLRHEVEASPPVAEPEEEATKHSEIVEPAPVSEPPAPPVRPATTTTSVRPRDESLEETMARARHMLRERTGKAVEQLPVESHLFKGGTISGLCGVHGCGLTGKDPAHIRPDLVPVEQDPSKCPKCQEPLVNGECWSCP